MSSLLIQLVSYHCCPDSPYAIYWVSYPFTSFTFCTDCALRCSADRSLISLSLAAHILYKSCACAPSTSSSNVSLSLSALIPSSSSFHTALVCESVAQNKRYKSGDGDNVWQPLFLAVSVDFSSGFFPQIPNSAQLLEVSKRGGNRRKYHYDSFIISKKPRNYHHIQHIS